MTIGQRIAAKRKELDLSQEGLGECLGVSRQSIYKWESDSSLPEIDKLIALSRLFGVSVGWLLGVEEEKEDAPPPEDNGELNENQLKLVEEIVGRYLAAQPRPKKRKRWPFVLAGVLLALALFHLFNRLDQLDDRYNNLQNSIGNISSNVNQQIGTITDRVEQVLKAQNDLTADYSTQLLSADLKRNTVTFSARVVPKTYVEGMEILFLADSGDGPAEFPSIQEPGHAFTAEITCELTDSITLSAVFLTGDTRQTQLLDTYEGLYGGSLPEVDISGLEGTFLHDVTSENGLFRLPADTGWLQRKNTDTKFGTAEVQALRVGLFKNYELLTWLEPCEKPESWSVDAEEFFHFPGLSLTLEKGDILLFAAIFTDQYGRQGVTPCIPAFECLGDEISWLGGDATGYFDLSNYTF